MNARMMFTSGMWSYAPPVCPVRPLASETAVKKTIASRQSWTLCLSVSRCSGESVGRLGSSLSGLSCLRSMGNVSLAMRRGNILAGTRARKCAAILAGGLDGRFSCTNPVLVLSRGSTTAGRYCMRFIRVAAILLTVCVGVALAQDSSTPAGGVTDEAFDAALAKAASAEPGSADFVAALQSVAPRFSAIEPATQPASGAWHNVPLNTRGKKVDAFRFRVPEGERRDLFWALAFSPKSMGRWYIAPAEGPVGKGFSSFLKASPAKLFKGTPPEGFVGIVQSLSS